MKRILFIAVCLAIGAVTAQAQVVPMYSEVYKEKTGVLEYKEWKSANGNLRQETPDGKVTIMRIDSMKMYKLDPAAKTASVLPLSQDLASPDMKGRKRQLQLIEENISVEGYATNHYKVWDARPENDAGANEREEWIHAPFNTWIRSFWDPLLGASVRRNIRQGAQPANLFEIPADYKRSDMLGGDVMNILDMMQGKGKAGEAMKQGQQDVQDIRQRRDEVEKSNMTEQEQLIEALKMLGGGKQ